MADSACLKGHDKLYFKPASIGFLMAACFLIPWQIYCVVSNENLRKPPLPIGDGPDYEVLGYSLSQGLGFQFLWNDPTWRAAYLEQGDYVHLSRQSESGLTTARPPGYPCLIALIYSLIRRGPDAFAAVRIMAALLIGLSGAISVGLSIWLVQISRFSRLSQAIPHLLDSIDDRQSPSGHRVNHFHWPMVLAGLAAFLFAITDRTLRTYAVDFLSEPLALFLTTGFTIVAMAWCHWPNRWLLSTMAILTAAMILTRSLQIFWLPGLVFLVWWTVPIGQSRWQAVLYASFVLFLLGPWWIRNVWLLEAFMPMGTQGPPSILGGYCDEALLGNGDWQPAGEKRLRHFIDQKMDSKSCTTLEREVQVARAAIFEIRRWAWDHLGELPALMCRRLLRHWSPYRGRSLVWKLFILVGAIALTRHSPLHAKWLVGLMVISSLTVMMLYENGGRFLVPLYGMLYALAGYGIVAICSSKIISTCFADEPFQNQERVTDPKPEA